MRIYLFIKIIFVLVKATYGLDIRFLADHQYSSAYSTQDYSDNYHKIPISNLLDTTLSQQSFTIAAKFDSKQTISGVKSNLMYIGLNSDPTTYFMNVQFDFTQSPIQLQIEESASSSLASQSFSYPNFFNSGVHEIAISFNQISSTSYQISFVLRNSMDNNISNTFTQASQITITDLSLYTLYLSSFQLNLSSSFYQGSVYKVFSVRNQFIDFTTNSELSQFSLMLSEQAQELFTLFKYFVKDQLDTKNCIPDESYYSQNCFYFNKSPITSYGTGYATFYGGNYLYTSISMQKYFSYYNLNNPDLFLTISFWFYLQSVNQVNNSNSPLMTFYLGNQQFISVYYYYVSSTQYQLSILWNKQQQRTDLTSFTLSVQQYYFILVSYYSFSRQNLQVLIYDSNTLQLSQNLNLGPVGFNLGTPTQDLLINFGDTLAQIPGGSFYRISQYSINLSSSIIYTPSIATSIISNCEVVIYVRNTFVCLLCQVNYFLLNNACLVQCSANTYNQMQQTRSCIPACSYKCSSCNPSTPSKCIQCSSSDRDLSINCLCKTGYEDFMSNNCQILSFIVDDYYDTIISNNWTVSKSFNNGFTQTPFLILSITKVASDISDIKAVTVASSQITTTSYSVQLQGSFNSNGGYFNTDFHLQVIVLPNTSQYNSGVLNFIITDQNTVSQQFSLGNYDFQTYGQYQILTFISGIQFGNNAGQSQTSISLSVQTDLANKLILVTASQIQQIQITYLICPSNMPSLYHSSQITQNPGVYIDPTFKHYQKTHISNYTLNGMMSDITSLRYKNIYGLTGISTSFLQSSQLIDYELIPRSNPTIQQIRLSMKSYELFQYSGNVLYLALPYNQFDNCQTRDFQTRTCFFCKQNYLNFNDNCQTANAQVQIILSQFFDKLVISFPYAISTKGYQGPENSNLLCQYIFDSSTYQKLAQSSLCSIQSNLINIILDFDATIFSGDTIVFNNVVMVSQYQAVIINYTGNIVTQSSLPQPDVILDYHPVINQCDNLIIVIKQFLNTVNKGVSSFQWTLDSMVPNIQALNDNIQQILNQVNTNQTPTIIVPLQYFIQEVQLSFTLSYQYKIKTSSTKSINIQVLGQTQINIAGRQLVEGPYYIKDLITIYFDVLIVMCNQNQIQLIDTQQQLNINIQESTLGINNNLSLQNNRSFQQVFQPYSLQVNTQYNFQLTFQTDSGVSGTSNYYLKMSRSPLIIQIQGGNRIQNYSDQLILTSDIRDLDLQQSLNQDQQIYYTWSCIDLQTQGACRDIEQNIIPIPQNSILLKFDPLTFTAYTNVQFSLVGNKDTRTSISQVVISFIDNSIPQSLVNFKDDILIRNSINWNDTQSKLTQILTLSLLSEDIISRPNFYPAIQQQIEYIYSQLMNLTTNEYQQSTFSTLATQQISKMTQGSLNKSTKTSLDNILNYIEQLLKVIQNQLSQNSQIQYLKDLYNQQIYNSFNILDQATALAQDNSTVQANIIQLSQQIGGLLNLDALPNENAKQFNGSNILVVSQLVTSKNLPFYLDQSLSDSTWQSNVKQLPQFQEKLNQVYQVSYKQYNKNLYMNEKPFQDFLQIMQKNQTSYTIKNYSVIDPLIQTIENQTNLVPPQSVFYTFKPIQNETLNCINRNNNEWTTEGCKTVYNAQLNNYDCVCDSLNPVTVFNSIENIFTNNSNIKTIFSEQGLDNISNFDSFYKYISFWEICCLTVLFLILFIYGAYLDKKSLLYNPYLISKISNQDLQLNQEKSNKKSKENQIQVENQEILKQDDLIQGKISKPSNILNDLEHKSSSHSINLVQSQMQQVDMQNKINDQQNTEILISQSSPFIPQQSKGQKNQKNTKENKEENKDIELTKRDIVPATPLQACLNSEKSLIGNQQSSDSKQKKLESINNLKGILYFHDIFSIFLIYDQELSRFSRFLVQYVRILHVYDSNIIFNQSYTIIQVVFIQLANIIAVTLITKIIEFGFSRRGILLKVLRLIIFLLVGFYYYAFFAIISGQDPSSTNEISLKFLCTLLIGVFATDIFFALLLRYLGIKLATKQDLQGIYLKLSDFIKLQLILQNI
ncbi:hypothetical protein ABPG74_002415 [Tetrahymena malaccensis]